MGTNTWYVCEDCSQIVFRLHNKSGGIVDLMNMKITQLLVGYFYANEDILASIIGKVFALEKDIAIEDNPDIIHDRLADQSHLDSLDDQPSSDDDRLADQSRLIHDSQDYIPESTSYTSVDLVKMYTVWLFGYEFDKHSRESVRELITSRCDNCGGMDKATPSIYHTPAECICKLKFGVRLLKITYDIPQCELSELVIKYRDICQVVADTSIKNRYGLLDMANHRHDNIESFLNYLSRFGIIPIEYEGDVEIRISENSSKYSLISLLINLPETACKCIKELMADAYEYKKFYKEISSDILKYRKLFMLFNENLEIKTIIAPLYKKLGNRRVKKPDRCISYTSACVPKPRSKSSTLVAENIAKKDYNFFYRNPGLIEYYMLINKLEDYPLPDYNLRPV